MMRSSKAQGPGLRNIGDMNKTIAFVTNNYTPYSGGVVSSINATVDQLRDRGYKVYIICPDFLGKSHDDPDGVIRLPSLFHFKYKQNHMMVPWRPNHHLRRVLAAIHPDVVHVHHPFFLGPLAVLWAQEHRIKTVFTYHTMYEKYLHYLPLLPTWLFKTVIIKRVLRFCRSVDQIVVPSAGMKSYLAAHGVTNTTIIPSGLQNHFLEKPCMFKKLQKPYQLLYVGRFVKEKNIPLLFDLLGQLPDSFSLTLVGYGEQLDQLKEYAYERCRLSPERVRFMIKPDKQTLRDQYLNAHLFLFPSQSDTQGLVLVESMACSTPVVALDGVGQRDVIVPGENGFLVHTLEAMRDTILMLVAHEELYARLQRNAWITARAYDPKRLVDRLITLYED